MYITESESKILINILLDFINGKEFEMPYVFNQDGKPLEYKPVSGIHKDYEGNEIRILEISYPRGMGLLPIWSFKVKDN